MAGLYASLNYASDIDFDTDEERIDFVVDLLRDIDIDRIPDVLKKIKYKSEMENESFLMIFDMVKSLDDSPVVRDYFNKVILILAKIREEGKNAEDKQY